MNAVTICSSLSNAARSADSCASACQSSVPPKPEAAMAQDRLAGELWKNAAWWANQISKERP